MHNSHSTWYKLRKTPIKLVFIASLTLHLSVGCSFEERNTWQEENVVNVTDTLDYIALDKPFEMQVVAGTTVVLSDGKTTLNLTLNGMKVKCVKIQNECIGNQYVFDFSAGNTGDFTRFQLVMNEPQNMDLLEYDIEEILEAEIFDHTFTLLDLNFSIDKHSISMLISKHI